MSKIVKPVRTALLSECKQYRYLLTRYFGNEPSKARNAPYLLFVMLNPSTADAMVDDPTILTCQRIAKARGYSKIMVVNLYAYRSTDPLGLFAPGVFNPVGPDNDERIRRAARGASEVIVAWGRHARKDRVVEVRRILRGVRKQLMCLGHNKDKSPKHPLYLRADTPVVPWVTANPQQEQQA